MLPAKPTCPVCGSDEAHGFHEGERVHIDMGYHVQVEPNGCEFCGYVQGNGTERYPDNFELARKCFEVWPWRL